MIFIATCSVLLPPWLIAEAHSFYQPNQPNHRGSTRHHTMSTSLRRSFNDVDEFPPLDGNSKSNLVRKCNDTRGANTSVSTCSNGAKLFPGDTQDPDTSCAFVRKFTKNNRRRNKKHQKLDQKNGVSNNLHDSHSTESIVTGSDFVRSRVGVLTHIYNEDMDEALRTHQIGFKADFLIAPIEPVRSYQNPNKFQAIPDLSTSNYNWQTSVALSLGQANLESYNGSTARRFRDLLDHAIYLPIKALLIDCPRSKLACAALASIVNDCLLENISSMRPLVLFKLPLVKSAYRPLVGKITEFEKHDILATVSSESGCASPKGSDRTNKSSSISSLDPPNEQHSACSFKYDHAWTQWNNLRSHLNADPRIGVCLVIDDDLPDDLEELERWTGEPVRMIVLTADQFVNSPKCSKKVRLSPLCKNFMRKVATFNSLKTSFVVEAFSPYTSLNAHLEHLVHLMNSLAESQQDRDHLISWHDRLLSPLQPLSSNLDSDTYEVFERDPTKYIIYRDAMIEAIQTLVARRNSHGKRFVLMVLGAGRGPLVDRFIEAVNTVGSNNQFKIYALDKNKSSVRSLQYKKKTKWFDTTGKIETEVVEADMRSWQPKEKADIIATELLGSFGDNELSPECIDGLWRFATPSTISIPQQYSSYVAPISSFKMHQQLYARSNRNVFDKIYVVNLNNCYYIDETQKLFDFSHKDISKRPEPYQNERYKELSFKSKVDTVCHGFAGFFSAKLFGTVELSTVVNGKTPFMDSWFAAYIPLEQPIQLPKGTKLAVQFWRKESLSKVWYQWVVTEPVASRVYSPSTLSCTNEGTVIPKFTN